MISGSTTSSAHETSPTGTAGGASGQDMGHIIEQLCQNQTTKPPVTDKGKRAATPIVSSPPDGGKDGSEIQQLVNKLCTVYHQQHNGPEPVPQGTNGPSSGSSPSGPANEKRAAPASEEQPSDQSNSTTGPGSEGPPHGHSKPGGQGHPPQGQGDWKKLLEQLCSHTKGQGQGGTSGAPGGPEKGGPPSDSTASGDSSPTEKRAATSGGPSGHPGSGPNGHNGDPLEKLCSMMHNKGQGNGGASGSATPPSTNPDSTGNPEASSGSGSPAGSSTSTEASSASSTDSPSA
ncbi:hypothetical protein D9758_015209 [Tetrapyrgos nigripes]|uniref:Uncharacterized protein n=1 Tax=Tetrapyrgos nigripes TaxID=182062 RepID=A0A8H5CK02_9AGAR|nr:hypothetical protein D9758_015209 [Tetrapyrgos nigripes]